MKSEFGRPSVFLPEETSLLPRRPTAGQAKLRPEGLRGLVGARRKIPRSQALLGHEPQGAQGPLVQSLANTPPTVYSNIYY